MKTLNDAWGKDDRDLAELRYHVAQEPDLFRESGTPEGPAINIGR